MDTHCIPTLHMYLDGTLAKKKYTNFYQSHKTKRLVSVVRLIVWMLLEEWRQKMRQLILSLNISTSAMNIATTFMTLDFCTVQPLSYSFHFFSAFIRKILQIKLPRSLAGDSYRKWHQVNCNFFSWPISLEELIIDWAIDLVLIFLSR